jgi:hypothetical protein
MEANNLKTNTYTAPTCSLLVRSKGSPLPHLARINPPKPIDFDLQIHYPEASDGDRVQIQGTPEQLANLHREIGQYVQNLISEFPLPAIGQSPNPTTTDRGNSTSIPNLPGLRQSQNSTTDRQEAESSAPTQLSLQNISKLLNRWQQDTTAESFADRPTPDGEPSVEGERVGATASLPYLTKNSEDLSYSLHLGDLALTNDREVVILSALQLFDLASILDSATNELGIKPVATAIGKPRKSVESSVDLHRSSDDRVSNPIATEDRPPSTESTLATRLPNLPRLATSSNSSALYSPTAEPYTGYSTDRPALFAALPWAAAAAVAVGAPLVLLGPNSSSLKEITSKVKLPEVKAPDFKGMQESIASKLPQSNSAPAVDASPNPGVSTAPWQVQPVEPPAGVQSQEKGQNGDGIGVAPLPSTLMGREVRNSATNNALAKATLIPDNPKKMQVPAGGFPPAAPTAQTTTTSVKVKTPSPTKEKTTIAAVPKVFTEDSGAKLPKVSVNTKPSVAPKSKSPAIEPEKMAISPQQVTIAPDLAKMPSIDVLNRTAKQKTPTLSNPLPPQTTAKKPTSAKTTKAAQSPTVKPAKVATKPQPALVPVEPLMSVPQAQQPTYSPEINTAPVTIPKSEANPAIGMGEGSSSSQTANTNTPGTEIEPPQVSSVPANDPFNSPAIKATKRYLQGKWKADPQEFNPLQYVIAIDGKNGKIIKVSPQGESAQKYLKQTGIIKPGDRILSAPTADSGNRRIRAILQPDGNVDAFEEP